MNSTSSQPSHFLSTLPIFHIARIVLEAKTPLAVCSGRTNRVFDSDLVRDASGLPMIPGTAIAGVLRHLYQTVHGSGAKDTVDSDRVFGFQDRALGGASHLEVSAAVIHNSHDKPAQAHDDCRDLLLNFAARLQPEFRERVAISDAGVARDMGKFDRAILPAGFRFSVELVLHESSNIPSQWQDLLDLLRHPLFRLGASTRAGLGAISVVRIATASWDLRIPDEAEQYRQLSSQIGDVSSLKNLASPMPSEIPPTSYALHDYSVALTPLAGWRFGEGLASLLVNNGSDKKVADMLPKTERRIHWVNGNGKLGESQILLPAASIKGALWHRTYFHACCYANKLVDAEDAAPSAADVMPEKVNAAMTALFGDAAQHATGTGNVGNVIIDDVFIDVPKSPDKVIGQQMHNVIDRFSGGVRNRMLFSEELLFNLGEINIAIWIDQTRMAKQHPEACDLAIKSFTQALEDLSAGRLALGGGTSKGHGYFSATRKPPTNSLSNASHPASA